MYSENIANDVKLFSKAFLSNQLARFAPALYVKLTNQTGRGEKDMNTRQIADYFIACFDEYLEQLDVNKENAYAYLKGKLILEYGPGDILGVALLMYAHGAETVHCVDRFPLQKFTATNIEIYRRLLDGLDGERQERARGAFVEYGKPESGFDSSAINYLVTRDGLSGRTAQYDLIISRSVLEHVSNLQRTMADIAASLKKEGISIHKVDLKSHGLDRYQTYDFLTWPDGLYRLMYSHKGFPNRCRVDKYRDVVRLAGLSVLKLAPTELLTTEKINLIVDKVALQFRDISTEELSWMSFWMIVAPAASKQRREFQSTAIRV